MVPIALGLILAPAIAVVSSSRRIGDRLADAGLFISPGESVPHAPRDGDALSAFPAPAPLWSTSA